MMIDKEASSGSESDGWGTVVRDEAMLPKVMKEDLWEPHEIGATHTHQHLAPQLGKVFGPRRRCSNPDPPRRTSQSAARRRMTGLAPPAGLRPPKPNNNKNLLSNNCVIGKAQDSETAMEENGTDGSSYSPISKFGLTNPEAVSPRVLSYTRPYLLEFFLRSHFLVLMGRRGVGRRQLAALLKESGRYLVAESMFAALPCIQQFKCGIGYVEGPRVAFTSPNCRGKERETIINNLVGIGVPRSKIGLLMLCQPQCTEADPQYTELEAGDPVNMQRLEESEGWDPCNLLVVNTWEDYSVLSEVLRQIVPSLLKVTN